MNKLIEIIPDDLPEWMIKAMAEGQLFNTILKRDHDKQDLLDEVKAKFMNCKGEVRRVGVQIVEDMKD